MNFNKKTLLFFLLLWTSLSVFPQEKKEWKHSYTYRYFGIRDGLEQSQVFLSFQDSYGYLWFSTFGGVSRFDGLHFENFSKSDLHLDDKMKYINQYESAVYMISSNMITFIYPDRTIASYPLPDNYKIWRSEIEIVGNNLYLFNCRLPEQSSPGRNALFRFDLKNKTFTKLAEDLPSLQTCISDEKIYAVTFTEIKNCSLTLFRIENDTLRKVRIIRMEKEDFYIYFIKTQQNEWFAAIGQTPPATIGHFYRCFIEDDSIRWNYQTQLPEKIRVISSIERLDEHRFIIGEKTSLDYPAYIWDTKSHRLSSFPLDMSVCNHVSVDRDGNCWFSTEEGVYQCPRIFFESYQLGLGRNDNLWSVRKDSRGSVWFSSFGYGLWRADAQGRLHQAQTIHNGQHYPVKWGYMDNCDDSRGRVFLTHTGGIAFSDPKQGNPNRLEVLTTGVSLAVYSDEKTGNVYFGGYDSCGVLNVLHADGKLSAYRFDYRHIISISRDGNRNLRIGTFYGEARLDEENGKIVSDTVKRAYKGVISMSLDEKGTLWKATTQGIFAEDLQGKDRQISDRETNFVLHYKNQYLIWGLKDNLYLMDLPAYYRDGSIHVRTFGFYDGFNLLECGQNGANIDPDGYVWLAGSDKVIRFHPEQIMKIPHLQARPPYIAAIYNADKNSEWSLINTNRPIMLENSDNYLRFDILQASVTAPDKLIFRYKLNGYNEHWTVSGERSLIFQNVPHGTFRLEIQSSMNGEEWSESVFSPSVFIRNPFWLTFPGLLLLFLGILGITLLIIFYTRKISIRKEEEMRMIDGLKHRAVQAKFIPHFTGNVLNSINYLISKNPDSAQKYISDFAGFSHHTLLNSDKLCRTIQEELDYVRLYLKLEKLRFEEKLEYVITVAPEADMQKMIPTMVLQTFCENALKHGLRLKPDVGIITICVCREEDYCILSVEDNGIGREKAKTVKTEGTKEGLKIVQQQLDLFNKHQPRKASLQIIDLFDTEGQASGTRFELKVP